MTAPDLFTPIARTDDPDTSHAGADRIAPKRGTDAARAYAWYLANPKGATAREYAHWTKHDGGWKRVSDLLRKGLLRETGEVRDGGRVLVAVDSDGAK